MKDADLIAQVEAEFKRGGIREQHLVADGWHLDGLCDGQNIYVDPAPAIVESLLHEVLHRRFPTWSESHVTRTAFRLLQKMDGPTVRRWYRRYQRMAIKGKRPHKVDEFE
jgi:hypothetical protein